MVPEAEPVRQLLRSTGIQGADRLDFRGAHAQFTVGHWR